MALIEPGASFQDIYDAIEAAGAELMVSVPDIGWGSMGGNQQDNGLTYLPYGKDWRNIEAIFTREYFDNVKVCA